MKARRRPTSPWADLALLGIAINVCALVLSPLFRPDLNIWRDSLSYYAVGPWSVPQSFAFAAMGTTSIALAVGVARIPVDARWRTVCTALLIVAGLCSIGLVLFPMGTPGPRTFIGDLHQTCGTIGGVAQLIATLAFAAAIRKSPPWSSLIASAIAALLLALAGAILSQLALWLPKAGIPMGAAMRLIVVPLLLFWAAVALRLRQDSPVPSIRSAAGR